MSCPEREMDVFVTRNDDGYTFDDTYVTSVWSVDLRWVTDPGEHVASVVNARTPWITSCTTVPHAELDVGDMVRIGDIDGHTDYLVIIEKKIVSKLENRVYLNENVNATHYVKMRLHTGASGTSNFTDLAKPSADATDTLDGVLYTFTGTGTATSPGTFICYRLNHEVNVTMPPDPHFIAPSPKELEQQYKLEQRHKLTHSDMVASTLQPANYPACLYYPMYKVNKWLTHNGEISVDLDKGVRSVNSIKLVGYSCFIKRQAGPQVSHEMISDDWIALHINEIQGSVVSNNKAAHGAFCVLHAGSTKDNFIGAVEYHKHDTNGLYTHKFANPANIRTMHLKLLDRNGEPAHFGRIHLWFKISAQHG